MERSWCAGSGMLPRAQTERAGTHRPPYSRGQFPFGGRMSFAYRRTAFKGFPVRPNEDHWPAAGQARKAQEASRKTPSGPTAEQPGRETSLALWPGNVPDKDRPRDSRSMGRRRLACQAERKTMAILTVSRSVSRFPSAFHAGGGTWTPKNPGEPGFGRGRPKRQSSAHTPLYSILGRGASRKEHLRAACQEKSANPVLPANFLRIS